MLSLWIRPRGKKRQANLSVPLFVSLRNFQGIYNNQMFHDFHHPVGCQKSELLEDERAPTTAIESKKPFPFSM